jgi:demethylmacrocin O-methyltransferase
VDGRTWQALKDPGGTVSDTIRRRAGARRTGRTGLDELAREFGTDKCGLHRYTPHYTEHLQQWRRDEFTLFEIGIGGYSRAGRGGASLRMWKAFFPRANVVGLDTEDKSFVDEERIRSYRGTQIDAELLRRIVGDAGSVRVVIDDGSHRPAHIRETFRILFPLLENNGIYVIEDVQTSYWPRWGGSTDRHSTTTTMALVKDLLDGLNYEEFLEEDYTPTYSDLHVVGVHVYHNLVFIQKGTNAEGTNRSPKEREHVRQREETPAHES